MTSDEQRCTEDLLPLHFVSNRKGTIKHCQLAAHTTDSLANWVDANEGKETLGKWWVLHLTSVSRWSIFIQPEMKSEGNTKL